MTQLLVFLFLYFDYGFHVNLLLKCRLYLAGLAWRIRQRLPHLQRLTHLVRWLVSSCPSSQLALEELLKIRHQFLSSQKSLKGKDMQYALLSSTIGLYLEVVVHLTLLRYFNMSCFRIFHLICSVR